MCGVPAELVLRFLLHAVCETEHISSRAGIIMEDLLTLLFVFLCTIAYLFYRTFNNPKWEKTEALWNILPARFSHYEHTAT